MSTEPQAAPAAAAPAKKSRRGLLIVLVAVLLLLAGGGGGAYWFLFRGNAEAEAAEGEAAEPEPPPAPTGIVPLEPFVVNLADPSGTRFLRVTMSLVVADETIAHEIEEEEIVVARLRSAILELLAQKQSTELVTPEGKAELKKSIAEGAAHAAHELKVEDVLFSEFIVQF
jgi:flagellar FliL protein